MDGKTSIASMLIDSARPKKNFLRSAVVLRFSDILEEQQKTPTISRFICQVFH